ncbi:AraC family transcriptional regulator [Flammeovirga sp. SubArs3]|uniref:helix-turn-helix transcriptional regulator n=1 Tax=Flammeovirga sp. SubArs3 TaxID=2995316 RepID=UPI00248C631F|nr:AraC family transcriptional regulator [Flammeovirga sp. SubArs3]
MNEIKLQTGNALYIFELLKKKFNGTIENNVLTIQHPKIQLQFELFDSLLGLQIILHDVIYKEDITFIIDGSNESNKMLYFRFENKGNIIFKTPFDDIPAAKFGQSMSMLGTHLPITFKGKKGVHNQWVSIRISEEFIETNTAFLRDNFKKVLDINKDWVFFEMAPLEVSLRLKHLFSFDENDSKILKKGAVLGQSIEMISYFVDLLLNRDELQSIRGLHKEDIERMSTLKEELTQLFDKTPTLPILAQKYAVSESKLKRDFNAVFGTTIPRFHSNYKLEIAHQLLVTSNYSILEISRKLGYSSISKFSDVFKKKFGVPPKKISKKYNKK